MSTQDVKDQLPQTIGRYQIETLIGEGAMGRVYKAFDPHLDRHVAIKVIHADLIKTEEVMQRFRQEARAAGRLSHPNIVAVHEYEQEGPYAYLVMEFVEGESLKEKLERGYRPSLQEIGQLMRQLLEALHHAHERGVIHRDIKPANLMVTPDGQLKITDFGIARLEDSNLTRAGVLLGTPSYMAPEQCLSHKVDGRADLFAAGVILYQLLTGEKPFSGEQPTVVMQRILRVNPDPPSQLNPLLPKALDEVVRKALAKRPEDRYPDGQTFLKALDKALTQTATPAKGGEGGWKKWPKKWPLVLLGGALLTVLASGGALFWFWNRAPMPVPTEDSKTAAFGYVEANSTPQGALILLNGERFLGVTPATLQLKPGSHTLLFRKFGYRPTEIVVEVEAGTRVPVNVTLTEER